MALATRGQTAFACQRPRPDTVALVLRNRSSRASCITTCAILIEQNNTLTAKRVAISLTEAQQPGRSYVNFKATAADFERVLVRLSIAASLSPEARNLPAAAPNSPSTTTLPSWVGLLGTLFAGRRTDNQQQEHYISADSSQDDDSPLSHAVVMFTATWCGPCKVVYRELKQVAGRLQGRAPTAVLVLDVEEHAELASKLGIKALPTLLYLSPDASRGPIFTQGPVSAPSILDALDRAVGFGGRNMAAKWRKL